MAYYGAAGGHAGEGLPPQEQFRSALADVSRAAQDVQTVIGQLRDDPAVNQKGSVEKHKLEYITMQMGFYEGIIDTLTAKDAQLTRAALMGRQDAACQVVANNVYGKMTVILRSLEVGFRRMLTAPDSQFRDLYDAITGWIQRNPWLAAALPPVVGALGGGAAAAWHYQMGWCIFGVTAKCQCSAVVAKALLTSAACGFAAGILIAAVGLGICYSMSGGDEQRLRRFEDEQRQKLEDMVQRLERMNEQETLEEFEQLEGLCRGAFCQLQFSPAVDERSCPICLNDIDDASQATRAPNCQGRHFMHAQCWQVCMARRHSQLCPLCRR